MSQLQYLLFDLDGTLYTDETGLFAEVGKRIEHWVAEQLGLTPCAAKHLRREYYLQYGTTMAGLLRDHPELDIDAYLDFVHDVDVTKYLEPDPQLDLMLSTVLPAGQTALPCSWAFENIFNISLMSARSIITANLTPMPSKACCSALASRDGHAFCWTTSPATCLVRWRSGCAPFSSALEVTLGATPMPLSLTCWLPNPSSTRG
jgi:hypothetical protein